MEIMKNIKIKKNQDVKNVLLLFLFITIFILIITRFKYYFGSNVDWINQHWSIPEYFRTLFYDTHQLFPNFAFNIGGGQNIYYLSYYGLFNPLILISYLFPSINMMNYIIGLSITLIYIDCVLFYTWIRSKFDSKISFLITFMFVFSANLIYHSHKHIMFVNYIPFLILALISVDLYFKKNYKIPLVVCYFLIIMTSFYFSVGSLVVILLYYIYIYFKKMNTFKKLFINLFKLSIIMCIPILLSGILIIPTFYALISGRGVSDTSFDLASFIPNLSVSGLLYNPYSTGLTSFCFIAILFGLLSHKKEIKFLSIALCLISFFPFCIFLLNGTVYIDAKVLIPFTPLILIISGDFCKNIIENKINFKKHSSFLINFFVFALFASFFDKIFGLVSISKLIFLIIFSLETILMFLFLKRKTYKYIFYIPIIFTFLMVFICNTNDNLVLIENKYNSNISSIKNIVEDTASEDNSFYRIANYYNIHNNINRVFTPEYYQSTIYSSSTNKNFNNFYYNMIENETRFRNSAMMSQSNNLIFNIFMGNKYIIDKKNSRNNVYTKIKDYDDFTLYKNKYALPIGYTANKFMSYEEFSKLSYPYNIEAQMKYTIVDNCKKTKFDTEINKIDLPTNPNSIINLSNAQNNRSLNIELNDTYNYKIKLQKPIINKVVFLRFNVDNSNSKNKNDNWIEINGTRNKLTSKSCKYFNNNNTFDYIFPIIDSINEFEVKLSKGNYSISNLSLYTMPFDVIDKLQDEKYELSIDREKTAGDIIYGTINIPKKEFLVLSIPYDKGFNITVDGQKCDYQCVNSSFIGLNLDAGNHKIILSYKAPFRDIGKNISIFGVILFFILLSAELMGLLSHKFRDYEFDEKNTIKAIAVENKKN